MTRLYFLLLLPALLFLDGCALSGGTSDAPPPPDAHQRTREQLEQMRHSIAAFYTNYGQFPKTTGDLSWHSGGEDYEDAWGNEIGYAVSHDKTIRIWSLGADNQFGGTGDNEDIILTFNVLDLTPSMAEKAASPKKKKWF